VNFNVTGSAEFKAPLEELITSNGGKLVALGASCQYLVCPEEAMDKLTSIARAKGLELVNDQWVIDHVVSGEPVLENPTPSATPAPVPAPAPAATTKVTKAAPVAPAAKALAAKAKATPAPTKTAAKAPAKSSSAASAGGGGKPLAGMTICITGTLSEPRAAFEAKLIKHGATIAKTVTNSCTHLISAETGTKKCQDAEAKGVKIVDEDWIVAKMSGEDTGDDDGDEDNEDEGEEDEDEEDGEEEESGGDAANALEGMCFAITG
jgi:hypothetical protein